MILFFAVIGFLFTAAVLLIILVATFSTMFKSKKSKCPGSVGPQWPS